MVERMMVMGLEVLHPQLGAEVVAQEGDLAPQAAAAAASIVLGAAQVVVAVVDKYQNPP